MSIPHELIKYTNTPVQSVDSPPGYCAKLTAPKENNARMSLEDFDSSRGCSFQLLLNQFRKAITIGVLSMRNAHSNFTRNNARYRHSPNDERNNSTFVAIYSFNTRYEDFCHASFGLVDTGF